MESTTAQSIVQHLTFTLEGETFALDVSGVREVLESIPVTRIPRTPPYMLGVVNVRGSVVPVIDLRLKLGMRVSEQSEGACIVVLELPLPQGLVVLGALVDSVQEVIELDASQVEPPPRLGTAIRADFILGVGKLDGRFVMILDIRKVLDEDELGAIADGGSVPEA